MRRLPDQKAYKSEKPICLMLVLIKKMPYGFVSVVNKVNIYCTINEVFS